MPVYNHCEYIRQNLENTIPLVIPYKDKVSIYVSDNASTDGTGELVKRYAEKHPDIVSYYCQKENITASPNFNHAVHSVESEYVMILGDDDLMLPSFLPVLLKLIDEHPDVGLFHYDFYLGKSQYDKRGESKVTYSGYSIYNSGRIFIQDFLEKPSFVSSNLFKRNLWIAASKDVKNDCVGYVWLSILYYSILNCKCIYVNIPLLIQGVPKKRAYATNWPLYYIYGLSQLFYYLDEEISGLYDTWIRHSQQEQFRRMFVTITEISSFPQLYLEKKRLLDKHLSATFFLKYFHLCIHPVFSQIIRYTVGLGVEFVRAMHRL